MSDKKEIEVKLEQMLKKYPNLSDYREEILNLATTPEDLEQIVEKLSDDLMDGSNLLML